MIDFICDKLGMYDRYAPTWEGVLREIMYWLCIDLVPHHLWDEMYYVSIIIYKLDMSPRTHLFLSQSLILVNKQQDKHDPCS